MTTKECCPFITDTGALFMLKTISILLKFSNLGKIIMGLSPSKYYMTIKIPKLKISGRTQETKAHCTS